MRDAKKDDLPLKAKVLIVDDGETIRASLRILEHGDFEVASAASVNEALKLIGSRMFDVLLSDLHMPGAGDGLTVVSAMRHSNPAAVTIIFSGFPEMKEAAAAILLQTDEILVKPMAPEVLVQTVRERLKRGAGGSPGRAENVAIIIEQGTQSTIDDWLRRVELEPHLFAAALGAEERCSHLPQLFRDLVFRLRNPLPLGTRAFVSSSAASHGLLRRKQGYSAAMIVEESRVLQASIFQNPAK
jgi:CheY-like chemotaxis protein